MHQQPPQTPLCFSARRAKASQVEASRARISCPSRSSSHPRRLPAEIGVLAHPAVDLLAEQVGVAGVTAVLLEHVGHEPAETHVEVVAPPQLDELLEPAVREPGGEDLPRARDRCVVRRVEIRRLVVGRGLEVPVRLGVPVVRAPRLRGRRAVEVPGEVDVLDAGQVLEQPADRQRRRADAVPQPVAVEAVGLPAEGRALPVEGRDQVLGRRGGEGWLPGGCRSWAAR